MSFKIACRNADAKIEKSNTLANIFIQFEKKFTNEIFS
jgi:hypothetical protein